MTISDTYWYRYQGAKDAGACATANCGPAVFAAAIGYATQNYLPVTDVRVAQREIVPWHRLQRCLSRARPLGSQLSEDLVHEGAPGRGQHAEPSLCSPYCTWTLSVRAPDYLKPGTDPAKHFGRFHDYTYGHFVVVKAITEDGAWVVIDDPYVFDKSAWGWYKGGLPKGHNRYIKYAEFEQAFRYFGLQGIEIIPG